MKLVDATDCGNTSDVFCTAISSITDLGGGVIRATYCAMKDDGESGDRNWVVDHQIWSAAAFLDAVQAATAAWQELQTTKRPRLVAGAVH